MSEKTEAEIALECAKTIMDGMKRKALNYIGEFNTLFVYLEKQVRMEKRK